RPCSPESHRDDTAPHPPRLARPRTGRNRPSMRLRRDVLIRVRLFSGAGGGSLAEVPAQRRGEFVRLGFGSVETAHETSEGAASAIELEAVALQRIHRAVRHLEKDLVRFDRGQYPSGGNIAQRGGAARRWPVRGPRPP